MQLRSRQLVPPATAEVPNKKRKTVKRATAVRELQSRQLVPPATAELPNKKRETMKRATAVMQQQLRSRQLVPPAAAEVPNKKRETVKRATEVMQQQLRSRQLVPPATAESSNKKREMVKRATAVMQQQLRSQQLVPPATAELPNKKRETVKRATAVSNKKRKAVAQTNQPAYVVNSRRRRTNNSLPPQPARPDNNVVQLDDNIENWKYKGMHLSEIDFNKIKDLFSIQSRLLLALKAHIPGLYNVVIDRDPNNPKEITFLVREELRVMKSKTRLSDTIIASIKVTSESQFSYYVFEILAREVAENLGITVAVLRSASKYAFGTPIICCETATGDYIPAEDWASLLEPLIKEEPPVAENSLKAESS